MDARTWVARLRQLGASPWLGAALVAAAVGVLLVFGRAPAGPPGSGRPEGAGEYRQPGFHFRDIRLVGRSQGKKDWELEVAAIQAPRNSAKVDFHLVRRGVVYREGRPYLYLAADGGVYYPEQNNFVMKGNIVLSRENGDILRAQELQWNPLTRQVTSTLPVEAKVGDVWFRANRFTVDVQTETLVAAGEILLAKGNGERLSGDTLVYSLSTDRWEIQGEAELSLRTGDDDQDYVAPGLGGGPPPQLGQGSEQR